MDPRHRSYYGHYYDDDQYDQCDDQYNGNIDDMAFNDQYYQPDFAFDGTSDGGELTDDIVNSSPSPRERIHSTYPPQAQYHDPIEYYPEPESEAYRTPLNNAPNFDRDLQTQFAVHTQAPIRIPYQNETTYGIRARPPQSQFRPPDSFQPRPRKSEQTVHSQGFQPRNVQRLTLRPVSDLPDMYRGLFKFGVFNAVQSSCFDGVFFCSQNMVISAPTGSGKTVLFELAIIKMLSEARETGQNVKAVYVAPTKALCSERYRDWANKFDALGAKCCELTGDTITFGKSAWGDAKNATIIITTGEKWDSLTRNWADHSRILCQIQLFLVDEVHILNEARGSTLEVVVSRMKLRGTSVRFLFVSATVPNIHDIANWIGHDALSGSASVYEFGEEYRPCRLIRHVVSFPRPKGQNDFVFSKTLDYKLFQVLQKYSSGKPILVFVATRKGVFSTAEQLVKDYNNTMAKKQSLPWTKPGRVNRVFSDKRLSELVSLGIGVHHAGLNMDDRRAVEELFLNKILRIVVATTTLAVGVNLPAHTVVMKGVHTFQNNTSVEYSDLDVMQMLGRAGRPQFDKDGMAIIMCESELESKYRALAQGKTIVESSLHTNLSEHLNSEIGLGTIIDVSSAKTWLKSSFLFQRIQKNPMHYSAALEKGQREDEGGNGDGQLGKMENLKTLEERVDDMVVKSIKSLKKEGLVSMGSENRSDADAVSCTEYGDIMSKLYLRQRTMALIMAIPERASIREVLEVIANADEFTESRLRASDKTIYNKLRRHNDIRYEVKKVERTTDKILLLIQAVLGGISLSSPEYRSNESQPHLEAYSVFKHLPRIAKAVVEVSIVKKYGSPLKHGLELMRCFTAKAWEDRPVVLRQIESIGEKSLKVLAEHGITTIPILREQDSLRLEALLNRKPPFGLEMLAAAREFPMYTLKVEEIRVHTDGGRTPVEVELSIECGVLEEAGPTRLKKPKSRMSHMTSVLTLTSDHQLVDFRRISTKILKEAKTFEVCAMLEKPSQTIIIYISSESYAGVTVTKTYKPRIAPSEYPTLDTKPMTALELELQGLEDIEDLFEMDVDEHGDVKEDKKPEPIVFKDLRKSSAKKPLGTVTQSQASSARGKEPEAVPPPKRECSHSCKDKQTCRHLCCREGLRDAPQTKVKAAAAKVSTKPSIDRSKNQSSLQSYITRPKPKPRVNPDNTLNDLESFHKNTSVQDNLKLPQGHRIKLDPSPNTSRRKKRPAPNFDIQFATIFSPNVYQYDDLPATLDNDDELPTPYEILTSTKKGQRSHSPSDNYSNSELDDLIRDLSSDDLPLLGPSAATKDIDGRVKKKAKLDTEDRVFSKTNTEDNASRTTVSHQESPLFVEDSDDDEVEFVDNHTPITVDDDLNSQYYNATTATPDLTMSHSYEEEDELNEDPMTYDDIPIQQFSSTRVSQTNNSLNMPERLGIVFKPQDHMRDSEVQKISEPPKQDEMGMEEEDEFAVFEAWLDQHTV